MGKPGWLIDYERLERDSRKVAYAIPCEARRSEKGWVLDAVPMKGASNKKLNVNSRRRVERG